MLLPLPETLRTEEKRRILIICPGLGQQLKEGSDKSRKQLHHVIGCVAFPTG